MTDPTIDPEQYVSENREQLTDVIRNGQDTFTRALAIAVTTKYGEAPTVEELIAELDAAEDVLQ